MAECICTGGFVRGHRWDCPAGKGTIRENQAGGWNKAEETLKRIMLLEEQNAALLEALKMIEELGRSASKNSRGALMGDWARQAIAKAEAA